MNRKGLLLLAFLLFLYMVPSFTVATEYETSDQSITSFSESLPDDVLFYPDGITWDSLTDPDYGGSILLEGSDDVTDNVLTTFADDDNDEDGTLLNGLTASASPITISLDFTVTSYSKDCTSIDFEITAYSLIGLGGSDDVIYSEEITGNGAISIEEDTTLSSVGSIKFMITYTGSVIDSHLILTIDAAETYMLTLADADHYAESFASVDDWTLFIGLPQSTDGDVMTWPQVGDNNYDSLFVNGPSLSTGSKYIEFRAKSNISTTYLQVITYTEDSRAGDSTYQSLGFLTTSWATIKVYTSVAIECLLLYAKDTTSPSALQVDYLRISPANETGGWQHDGSTTIGLTNSSDSEITYSTSTDGDILTLSAVRNAGSGALNAYFRFVYDTTTTSCDIERDYYQFFKLRYNATLQGGNSYIAPKFALDGYWGTIDLIEDGTFRIGYINVASFTLASADKYVEFSANLDAVGKGFTLEIDYIKAYSIANYTYAGTGVSTDDVLYTDSGVLYCSGTSFTSIVLDHDPALSIETGIGGLWNLTTSSGTPQIDFYIDTAWAGYSSETNGVLANGTLTDIRIKFTASANVAAITFLIRIPEWNVLPSAILIFAVELNTMALDWLLILLGLIMIPTSTLYLAYGVKHDRSSDRLFYGLIIFFLGCGLLVGGILP